MDKFKIVVAGGLLLFIFFVILLSFILFSSGTGFGFGNTIAIIPVKGEITSDSCTAGPCTNYEEFSEMFKTAEKDPNVKAIVLDINSPGGGVFASREMAKIVEKSKKPVVAYIGEVGASGAYYAASAADEIIASEYSLTGSIGVETIIIGYSGLLDKLGINVTTIKRPENKDLGSPYRQMNESEKKEMQDIIDRIYNEFISDVAKNRNIPKEKVLEISEKKNMYIGIEAKENGLIDKIGTRDDAIKTAAEKAGIKGRIIVRNMGTNTERMLDDLIMKLGYGIGKAILEKENIKINSIQN